MPFVMGDRVLETTITTGTGVITLAGAVAGYRAFSAVATVNADWFYYVVDGGTEWEVGRGVRASATTFSRAATDVIAGSSGAGVLVNFSAGTKTVWMDIPSSAAKAARIDSSYNLMVNGGFSVDQALEDGTATGTAHLADCWRQNTNLAGSTLTSGRLVVTINSLFSHALQCTATVGAAGTVAQRAFLYQPIEGKRFIKLGYGGATAQNSVLSFWVKTTVSGTGVIAIRNPSLLRSYVKTYPINAGNTWEFKQLLIPGDVTGTWGGGFVSGGHIIFQMYCGSNFFGTDGTWVAGDFTGATGNTNFLATNGNTFSIAQVSLVPGVEGPSFDQARNMFLPYDDNLAQCQRYYEKSFAQGTVPAFGLGVNSGEFYVCSAVGAGVGFISNSFPFKRTKRVAPSMVLTNPVNANGEANDETAGSDCSATSPLSTDQMWAFTSVSSVGTAPGNTIGIHFTADARML